MICITVRRDDLRKLSCGEEGKIKIKNMPSSTTDAKGLVNILDSILKYRYLGRRRKI